MLKKMTSMAVAAVLAASVAVPSTAAAAELAAASVPSQVPAATLPYVDDVNDWGASRYILTVVAGGKPSALKSTSGKKALKVTKHRRGVWTVVVKRGAYVKLSVRAKGGKWKSIGYRAY